ncbi:MAG: hypothetical protein QM541_03345 [Flavobacterium sp.]|nr:hypothetical protein [Flavobacterium sp.]
MNNLIKISNILDDYFKEDKISRLQEIKEGMQVEFISDNKKYLSFSFDKQLPNKDFPKGLFPFFNRGEASVCAFCDYVIFSEENNKLYVLLIELKKGKHNVTKQLSAGKCFAEYIISTLNRVYDLKIKPEVRQISIRHRHIKPKQKQREIEYINNFHTFCNSKFWLRKYLK